MGRHEDDMQLVAAAGLDRDAWLLDDLASFVSKYLVATRDQVDAVALWVMHAHTIAACDTTPRLAVQSAEKASGKTRLLELLGLLVPAPLSVSNASAAALFRSIDAGPCTVLFDEVDAVFHPKAGGAAEDLRAMLNAGYLRGASVARCVGEGRTMRVHKFEVFAAVATAGIGILPDTLQSRSIVIRLKRRGPGESIEKFRRRLVVPEAERLAARCARWAEAHTEKLGSSYPPVPDELADRASDIWEPLLAVADLFGRDWPERARDAAVRLSGPTGHDDDSTTARLMADLAAIFADSGADRLTSAVIVAALLEREESGWGDWVTPLWLSRRLKRFEVHPKLMRFAGDDKPARGYLLSDLTDPIARYGPAGVLPATPVTPQVRGHESCNGLKSDPLHVTDPLHLKPLQDKGFRGGVTGVTGSEGGTPKVQDETGTEAAIRAFDRVLFGGAE
jgi:hypothetical protein